MATFQLRSFKKHLKNLHKYANTIGVKVHYCEEVSGDGMYSNGSIYLQDDLPQRQLLATFLHELGHAMDYDMINKKISLKIFSAYYRLYDNKNTKNDLKLVLISEQNAWNIGRVIAKRLKIRLGKWYDLEEKKALNDYRSS